MKRRKHRQPMASFDQINVTPLLDLTFLLLIAFMLTMPLMEYGTSVTPPEMNAKKLPDKQFKSVTIGADGSLSYQKESVTREELLARLRDLKASEPETVVLLRCDSTREYGEVIGLMRDIKNSGFTKISLVTQAERK
ncbi:MAG: biopolymer transporter ExbD [Lentisphaeria bacterium]|nr:biopolymer transporter ExbD [Lentisphaeria bacterium]MBQ7392781.1 biopolymer transporter ExbD [Lentisphaeria bacterium]MBR2641992.1 biopolymer transporter ExbD [Lentisphaeria bacterium]